jgi:hypothetical protein
MMAEETRGRKGRNEHGRAWRKRGIKWSRKGGCYSGLFFRTIKAVSLPAFTSGTHGKKEIFKGSKDLPSIGRERRKTGWFSDLCQAAFLFF